MSKNRQPKDMRKIQNVARALTTIETFVAKKLQVEVCDLREGLSKTPSHTTELISAKSAASMLGLKPKTLANWRVSGANGLKHISIGSRVFYRRNDLDAFITANAKSSTSDLGGNYA